MLKTICAHTKALLLTQVEVALAYKCEDSLTRRDLLQYVHRNRDNNARRIDTMGEAFSLFSQMSRLLEKGWVWNPFNKCKYFCTEQKMAEQERKMAETIKDLTLVKLGVTAHHPELKSFLGNATTSTSNFDILSFH